MKSKSLFLALTAIFCTSLSWAQSVYENTLLFDVKFSEGVTGTCSGTYLGGQLILTSAHCFRHSPLISTIGIGDKKAGSYFFKGQIFNVGGDRMDLTVMSISGRDMSHIKLIKMFDTLKDLGTGLETRLTSSKCVSIWGRISGEHCVGIASYDTSKLSAILKIRSLPGDSGGAVWIDDKFIGVIKGEGPTADTTLVRLVHSELLLNALDPKRNSDF